MIGRVRPSRSTELVGEYRREESDAEEWRAGMARAVDSDPGQVGMTAQSPGPDPAFQHVLESAQAGAGWAFTRLYKSLAPAVTDFLRAQGADDADDLTSEVFIKVFTGSGSFAGSEAQFRNWVFTIARCRLIDARRAKTRAHDAQASRGGSRHDEQGPTSAAAEDEALAGLAAERVAELLDQLSPGQRDVLALRFIARMSVEEVAGALAKQPAAVKALQRRALATLRRRSDVKSPDPGGHGRRRRGP